MPRGLQVDYREVETADGGSPTESFDQDGGTAQRVLEVAWADRKDAVWQILGYPSIDQTDPMNWRLRRYLPEFHPLYPWLIATGITATRGVGIVGTQGTQQYETINGRNLAAYNHCRMWVKYQSVDYDVLEDDEVANEFTRYRTFKAEPAAEYLSPPTGALTWSEGPAGVIGTKFPGNVGFIVGTIDFHWEWLQVPLEGLPLTTIQDTVGRVNKTDFAGCPAGTLLLLAAPYRRVNSPFGLRTFNVEYVARFNRRGHNRFYEFSTARDWLQASSDGAFYAPGSVPDGKLLYDERPFLDLFDVNAA